jgi:hypothetical protein
MLSFQSQSEEVDVEEDAENKKKANVETVEAEEFFVKYKNL